MKKILKGGGVYLFLALTIFLIYWLIWDNTGTKERWPISKTIVEMENESIRKISIKNNTLISGETNAGEQFESYIPLVMKDEFGRVLYNKVLDSEIRIEGEQPQERSILVDLLPMIFTILVFGLIWFFFMQNSAGGGSKAMSFGKSKAKLHKAEKGTRILFEDVAGLKEEKEELYELVDFLKNPKRYNSLGARIPKGVLMVGRPGTGKTYLSRAVAGEAGVPFFSISGSDFVEMFVGVGASRVRDMFDTAKKNAPCIIFIDEIDAVGRRRGAGLGGGHDEREQTLNQLLVEMDGFSDNQGIIIMAATNRPDILDPALLRPGRFDRQIMVGLPDIEEREQILQIHSRNKPVAPHVDFKVIARGTPGFTPADLENVLNEAAILSARKKESQITETTIEEATTKIIAGVEKKSRVITEKERKLTAYHEGGHAVVGRVLSPEDPVHQVTIIPRGMAGGFTMQIPLDERYYKSKTEMKNELCVLLAGRMGEKLIMGDISTGASNDLEKVTAIARAMVTKYGMAEGLSVMSYASDDDEVFLGRSMGHVKQNSEQVQAEIDMAVRRIVDEAYEKTEAILTEHLPHLHRVAEALLEFETIYNDEFEAAFNHGLEKVREVRAKARQKNKQSMDEYNEQKSREEAEKSAFIAPETLSEAPSEGVEREEAKEE